MGTTQIKDSAFQNCESTSDGGAIYSLGNLTITNTTFSNNTAGTNGGAIYTGDGGETAVTDSTFTDNKPDAISLADGASASGCDNVGLGGSMAEHCSVVTPSAGIRMLSFAGSLLAMVASFFV